MLRTLIQYPPCRLVRSAKFFAHLRACQLVRSKSCFLVCQCSGESSPVQKQTEPITEKIAVIPDKVNLLFSVRITILLLQLSFGS